MRINNVWEHGIISGDDRGDSVNNKSYRRGKKTRNI
jgi:hypothetical protein